jgi:hypothetical protein
MAVKIAAIRKKVSYPELPVRSFWRAFSCLMSPQAMINHSAQSPVAPF